MTDATLGRFTVRDVTIWDAPYVFGLFTNPRTVRYMGLPQLTDPLQASELIQRYTSGPARWLTVRAGVEFLGLVGLEIRGHQATITIAFKRTRRAMGAGREFSVPFVQWIFTHPQIWRVWAYCHVDNIGARRVLERMGANYEGTLRRFEMFPNISDEPQDVDVYAIVRQS